MTLYWPEDTLQIIEQMRAAHYLWREIADHFGCATDTAIIKYKELKLGIPDKEPGTKKKFTPEDDAIIREGYSKYEDLTVIAAKIGRRRGDVCQRIMRAHPDLMHKHRNVSTMAFIKNYGMDMVQQFDPNVEEAVIKLKAARIQAKADARARAIKAVEDHRALRLKLADEAIANGQSRNEAIFELRAGGLSLEVIGQHFGVSRERIRQVFDQMAIKKSIENQMKQNGSGTVQAVDKPVAEPNGGSKQRFEDEDDNPWSGFTYY